MLVESLHPRPEENNASRSFNLFLKEARQESPTGLHIAAYQRGGMRRVQVSLYNISDYSNTVLGLSCLITPTLWTKQWGRRKLGGIQTRNCNEWPFIYPHSDQLNVNLGHDNVSKFLDMINDCVLTVSHGTDKRRGDSWFNPIWCPGSGARCKCCWTVWKRWLQC